MKLVMNRTIGPGRLTLIMVVLISWLTILIVGIASAQQCKPLLIPGKRTLYQRVVTHPGADLYLSPGDSAQKPQKSIKPFTVYYVYERSSKNGTNWLMVGSSSNCKTRRSL